MNHLDKRIAEEIMGEPKPEGRTYIDSDGKERTAFEGRREGCWTLGGWGHWYPDSFSSNWNCCMKALKQCKDMDFNLFLDPFLDGDEHFMGYSVEVGIAEGKDKPSEGIVKSKVEKECHSLDDLPRVICEAMLEYRNDLPKS